MTRRLIALWICLFSFGCSGDERGASPDAGRDAGAPDGSYDVAPQDVAQDADVGGGSPCGASLVEEHAVAGWTIRLDHADGAWRATAPDGTVLAGPPACQEPAVLLLDEDARVRDAFANFQIDLQGDHSWTPHEARVPTFSGSDDAVRLHYRVGAHDAAIVFSAGAKGGLRVELEHPAKSAELRFASLADAAFFGLGTQVTGMDLRGRTFPLWTQEQGNGKPEGGGTFPLNNDPEAAYAPMGVLHTTSGWSAVVTHDGYTEVDLGHTDPDLLAVRSHRENPGFVFLTGTPPDRMTAVTEYTGRVRADVPAWVFGLWVDAVTGPDRLAEVTQTLRDEKIPASAVWSEDWIGGSETNFGFRLSYDWVWDEETYPNLPTLIDGLHARGFAFLGYFNTFLSQGTSLFPTAQEEGYFVNDADGAPILFADPAFRTAGLVDLFNPAAAAWLRAHQMTAVTDVGLDGWMADFSEWYPLKAPDGWARHNVYPLEYQRQNDANLRAARPDGNYVFFPRSGWASVNGGTAGVAPVMWGGDQDTGWAYDDGFPTIIPIGAHVGLSGVAIFGSDIGGYSSLRHPNTTKELWFRWASAGAMHPLMRTHHGGSHCDNWNFDRDAETLAHTRRWSSIHTLLYPEFQRLYREAVTLGWPITRHPWLVAPDAPKLWSGDHYLWFVGDDLLVAPVLGAGATSRTVELPDVGWWPLFGDAPLGEATTTANAAASELPIFVRPGRALTLLADAVDSFYGATDGATDLDDAAGRYRVALYPDGTGAAASVGDALNVVASDLGSFDAAAAELAGAALPDCTLPVTESCTDGVVVWLVDVTDATIEAGATIDVSSLTPVTVAIGVGGNAWGELAEAGSYTPNPDAPTWCPPEEPDD